MAKTLEEHNYYGIDATIIADSKNEFGQRITTFVVTHPRHILAEMNTHRMFSRNSASSRAIPFKRMVEKVKENPFIPIAWQKDHSGMQGKEYITSESDIRSCIGMWKQARDKAVYFAEELNYQGPEGRDKQAVTKQLCNRLLEPFVWHTAIITATEYENFFHLRCPQYRVLGKNEFYVRSWKDYRKNNLDRLNEIDSYSTIEKLQINEGAGEIHIMELAEKMWDTINENTPKKLKAGEWHIPFGESIDYQRLINEGLVREHEHVNEDLDEAAIKIAIARCARISYMTLGDNPKIDYKADIKLHDRLASMGHWSPFEHCARAMSEDEYLDSISGMIDHKQFVENELDQCMDKNGNSLHGWSGNFRGFVQYRKMFDNENVTI